MVVVIVVAVCMGCVMYGASNDVVVRVVWCNAVLVLMVILVMIVMVVVVVVIVSVECMVCGGGSNVVVGVVLCQ